MTSLRGKSAVVIGGSSGVGEATVKALISEGVRVTAVARGAEKLRARAPPFTRRPRRAVAHIESLLLTGQEIFATLVGTLQLARTVADSELSDQLLKAGQTAALMLARSIGFQRESRAS